MDSELPRRGITRRTFLTMSAAAAAGLAASRLLPSPRAARASAPHAVRVLVEDHPFGPGDLAGGDLDGLTATLDGVTLPASRGKGRLVSPVVRAATPFTHIGLHWDASGGPEALAFELRSSGGGGAWGPWEPVLVEALGRETASGETFGALVSADRDSLVQFRATFSSASDAASGASATLRGATLTLLNSKDGPQLASLAFVPPPDPSTVDRVTFTREEWGADESLRTDAAGAELWPPMYVPVKKAVVHHTATTNNYSDGEDAKAQVRAIHAYHARTLGWGDIGYNAIVDQYGNTYEGRYGRVLAGGREVLSEDVVAGHALSHNYGSTGIASLGTHTARGEGGKPGVEPTTALLSGIAGLIEWDCRRRSIDPGGVSDYLLSDDTWNQSLDNVPGHRDCNPTICPGDLLYSHLGSLRATVAAALARAPAPAVDVDFDTVLLSEAAVLSFSWGTGPVEYFLEGWRRVTPESEDLFYLSGSTPDHLPVAWVSGLESPAKLVDLAASLEAGHYTLHARTSAGSHRGEATVLVTEDRGSPPTNTPPSVTIDGPSNGATFAEGAAIDFAGSASDAEDGNLSADIDWSSSLDGLLGTGAAIDVPLTVGVHTISAEVADSDGSVGSDSIEITVVPPPTGITLTASGYKVRGMQHADLTWSGATSATIDVYRDGDIVAPGVANDGGYTDAIGARGGGSYVYVVCEAGAASVCSNEVVVTF